MDHYEPSLVKKKECCPCPHPAEESCEQRVSDTGWPAHQRKVLSSSHSQHEGPGMNGSCLNKSPADFSPSPEAASVTLSNSFMGKFIKWLDTLTQDPHSKLHGAEPWELWTPDWAQKVWGFFFFFKRRCLDILLVTVLVSKSKGIHGDFTWLCF